MIAYESVHVPRKVDVKGSKKAIFRGPQEMAKIAVRLHMNGSTKAMFIRALSDNGRTGMADALRLCGRMPLRPRTDADEQEEYDEDVEDGDDGQGDGGDDLAKGVEAAEEADHAEGPEGPDEARRLVGDGDGEEGHDHDEAVQPGPAPQPTPRVSETNFVRRPGGGLARRGCQQRFVINKANVYVWRGG